MRSLEVSEYELVFSAAGKQPTEEELIRLLRDCVGYLCGVEKVSDRVLSAAAQLHVISRNGTGVDNIDMAAARQRQIGVCRADGVNARGVAELTLSLLLALARSVPFGDQQLKQGRWERREGTELEAKTLGLVGCGRVGRLVAQFAFGLDMNVLAHDPFADGAFRPSPRFEFVTWEDLISQVDFISLHCPPAANGRPLIRHETIAAMKTGVYIVNTARASLLDEEAVLVALESGQIAGLATDVFTEEPPGDTRLVHHVKVIATPHIGGCTGASTARAVEVAVDNLLIALDNDLSTPEQ